MAILNAIIENNGNTLIIDFPHSIYDVYEKLLSIGIRKSPNDIMLTDNEDDDIQVKLLNGVCITAQISEFPSKDGDCILSQVLEDEVPEKYFLSPAAMRKILSIKNSEVLSSG